MAISYQDEYERQKSKAEALEGAVKNGVRRDNEKNRELVQLRARVKELEESGCEGCAGCTCEVPRNVDSEIHDAPMGEANGCTCSGECTCYE